MLRLYPIPYRQLNPDQQFERFDTIEADCWKAEGDPRPESHKLNPDSIVILSLGKKLSPESKVRIWLPHVSPSLEYLREENRESKKSLGIIRPDQGSMKFLCTRLTDEEREEREDALSVYQQAQLFSTDKAKPLPPPEYVFKYRFTSDGKQSEMRLHDWEVQAAYWKFTQQYGKQDGLLRLTEKYQEELPSQNPHLIMGTMLARMGQFIAIGLLRSTALERVEAQGGLF